MNETITLENTAATNAVANNSNKQALFINFAPFIYCFSAIKKNTQIVIIIQKHLEVHGNTIEIKL